MLADIVEFGEAIGELVKQMKNEPSFKGIYVVLENTRLSREDIDYLSHAVSKEMPCEVEYAFCNESSKVCWVRKENPDALSFKHNKIIECPKCTKFYDCLYNDEHIGHQEVFKCDCGERFVVKYDKSSEMDWHELFEDMWR